jgi:hypothetical protein
MMRWHEIIDQTGRTNNPPNARFTPRERKLPTTDVATDRDNQRHHESKSAFSSKVQKPWRDHRD